MKALSSILFVPLAIMGCSSGNDSDTLGPDATVTPSTVASPGDATVVGGSTPIVVVGSTPAIDENPPVAETPIIVIPNSPAETPVDEDPPTDDEPAVAATPTDDDEPSVADTPAVPTTPDADEPSSTDTVDGLFNITLANYEAVLNQALGVYAGQNYGLELMNLPRISERRYQQFPALEDSLSLTCDNGGNADITGELPVAVSPFQSVWNYSFTNCEDNDVELNGSLFRQTDSERIVFSSGFEQAQTDIGEEIVFDGTANFLFKNRPGGSTDRIWSTNELNLILENDNGAFSVNGTSTFYETVFPFTAFLSGSTTFSSELTDNQPVAALVTDDFVYSDLTPDFDDPETFFTVGTLLVSTQSGDTMILDADTGSNETVVVEINNEDGQTIRTHPWTDFTDSLIMPTEFEPDFAE